MIRGAVGYFIFFIILASFFTPDSYQVAQNTVSEMAAQGLPNAWIMRVGFMGFGILLCSGILIQVRRKTYPLSIAIPFAIYGISIFLTGIWSTVFVGYPAEEVFSVTMHSFFATIAGVSLIIAIMIHAWFALNKLVKGVDVLYIILITGFSAMFGLSLDDQGIIQRAMYLIAFSWIFFFSINSALKGKGGAIDE